MATLDAIGAGPRTIAGVLEKNGLQPLLRAASQILEDSSQLSEVEMLFISAMTIDLPTVKRVVKLYRKKAGDKPVLLGGPVTSDPRDAIEKAGASIAAIGESEETLEELLKLGLRDGIMPDAGALREVRGMAFSDGGRLRVNPLRAFMPRAEYDAHRPSTRVIVDYPLYFASRVYVEVLRGCSNYHRSRMSLPQLPRCTGCEKCTEGELRERYECPSSIPPGCGYCSVPGLYGPPRSRSVNRIAEETRELLGRGVKRIVLSAPDFMDYGRDLLVEPDPLTDPRNPSPNCEALEKLLSALSGIQEVADGDAVMMVENVKGNLVTEEAAKMLGTYLSGSPINLGCETGSDAHSRLLGRPSSPGEVLKAVERLRKNGLKPYVYFIHGLPGQSRSTAKETVTAIGESVRRGAERIILYRFQPLPMSAFSGMPHPPPAEKSQTSFMIREAARRANLRLKKRLVGTFLKVVMAEPYNRDRSFTVAYPLYHGPVVLVKGGKDQIGKVAIIIVNRVVSERLVEGRIAA